MAKAAWEIRQALVGDIGTVGQHAGALRSDALVSLGFGAAPTRTTTHQVKFDPAKHRCLPPNRPCG